MKISLSFRQKWTWKTFATFASCPTTRWWPPKSSPPSDTSSETHLLIRLGSKPRIPVLLFSTMVSMSFRTKVKAHLTLLQTWVVESFSFRLLNRNWQFFLSDQSRQLFRGLPPIQAETARPVNPPFLGQRRWPAWSARPASRLRSLLSACRVALSVRWPASAQPTTSG